MNNLKELTSNLAEKFLPLAVNNNSFFINDVDKNIVIDYNQEWVSSVISGLMVAVVRHAKDTCIRLSAKKFGHVIVFEIEESGCISSYAMACGLQDVQSLAAKIGGSLSISIQKPQNTTIAFSFPNLPVAA
jgi:glucose-6-phosphate-specific signal transduction histidine kinase